MYFYFVYFSKNYFVRHCTSIQWEMKIIIVSFINLYISKSDSTILYCAPFHLAIEMQYNKRSHPQRYYRPIWGCWVDRIDWEITQNQHTICRLANEQANHWNEQTETRILCTAQSYFVICTERKCRNRFIFGIFFFLPTV